MFNISQLSLSIPLVCQEVIHKKELIGGEGIWYSITNKGDSQLHPILSNSGLSGLFGSFSSSHPTSGKGSTHSEG